ncbi:leucine-rich repeat-containing G-protein coupled receptor 4-like [Ruditapes philippinarum]|uniref:leucine-rich repeat-containing G-protein coupled receptor 4-like n=1 Tax=Ruditapes philippinarum TaxID=129788 RepID=UPI00295B27B1|nr:leucine-rich repeat-containing G-protein coupled receptor 4-like [Ruditapes philippinarum]XP_060599718.1 leucine-rich repeat-containing G-protein coupled receptor 4-like [Ruditapes philippinarum]
MNICLLSVVILPLCIMGFECPDEISRVCTCYTTYTGSVRREERRHVDCSSRELRKVPYLDFREGSRLYEIRLQNNSITSLQARDFARKTHVRILDISGNPVGSSLRKSLLKKTVRGIKVLKVRDIGLDLQNMTSLNFVKDLHTLEELDLSGNLEFGVEMLPAIFVEQEIHSLKVLSLSLCRIRDINPHGFIGLNNLREMDLSQNYLSRVPRALNRLSLLRKLTLRENDITVIYHGDFTELNCLEELDLSKNLLGQIEAFRNGALFGLGNSLTRFHLHNTHLGFFPTRTLSELKELKHLDISHNTMRLLTNVSFSGRYSLTFLDISGNPWILDNQMFDGVKDSLVTLRMSNAGMTSVPRIALEKLHKLRNLDLSNNELGSLDNDSIYGISARRLSFRGNKISYISADTFSHYKRPLDIDLSQNTLGSLGFVFESEKCTFYNLNISYNGFLCDCQIEQLVNSRRVFDLFANCILKTGQKVAISNESMIYNLEKHCGKSSRTFCLWWAPKSGTSLFGTNPVLTLFLLLCVFYLLTSS